MDMNKRRDINSSPVVDLSFRSSLTARPRGEKTNDRRRMLNSAVSSTTELDTYRITLYLRYFIYLYTFIVVFSRMRIVSDRATWWILHPDEVFQSLEVAHSEVYGYGFRPYEFFPPPAQGTALSPSEKQHLSLGMYSMRSWIHPRFYVFLFRLKELLGIQVMPFEFAKLVHAFLAGLLPMTIYFFVRCLGMPRCGAALGAVLVGSSHHLVKLGTHTIINSLISPIFFGAMTVILLPAKDMAITQKNGTKAGSILQNSPQKSHRSRSMVSVQGISSNKGPRYGCSPLRHRNRSGTRTASPAKKPSTPVSETDQHAVGRKEHVINLNPDTRALFRVMAGFCLGMVAYARVDCAVLCLLMHAMFLPRVLEISNVAYPYTILGAFSGIILAGYDDFVSYGIWFVSPVQWTRFQIFHAGRIFGKRSFLTYINEMCFGNYTTATLVATNIVVVAMFALLMCGFLKKFGVLYGWYRREWKTMLLTSQLFLISCGTLLFYSLQPHKECRFVHDALVILYCSSAGSIYCLYQVAMAFLEGKENALFRHCIRLFLCAEICLFILQGLSSGPYRASAQEPGELCGAIASESADVNICLEYMSRQSDVTGLLLDFSIHLTGAYTVIHQNVPIIAKTHYEFREWSLASRQIFPSNPLFGDANNISVSIIDKIANFVTIENGPLIVKHVVAHPEYNYAVISEGRKFLDIGFRQVFSAGDVRVYKRIRSSKAKAALSKLASKIPYGMNSTVLQYEANWLITLQLYDVARERLNRALELEPKCVRCWHLLYVVLEKMDDPEQAKMAAHQCYRIIGKDKCNTPTEKIVLHPEYRLGMIMSV